MPFIPWLGENLDPVLADPSTVNWNPTAPQASPPLWLDRFFRNTKHPDANAANALAEAANQSVLFRTCEHFSVIGQSYTPTNSNGLGDRNRWRFAMKTGPRAHAIGVLVLIMPQDSGTDVNAYARLDLSTSTTGSPVAITETFVHGAAPLQSDNYKDWKQVFKIIAVDPSTTYYANFVDVDNCRLLTGTVFELGSLTENSAGGYCAVNNSTQTPVLDSARENLVTLSNALWAGAGGRLITWTNDISQFNTTSSTPKNILDETSTSVSASTPGWTLDLTRRSRLTQTSGISCVMAVHGTWTNGSGGGSGGSVYLKDSAGNTVASIVNGWSASGTASWVTTSVTLPATVDKYDVWFARGGGAGDSFNLTGVSIYQAS